MIIRWFSMCCILPDLLFVVFYFIRIYGQSFVLNPMTSSDFEMIRNDLLTL